MLGFSRNLAAELGPENVAVNMIAGGLVMTTGASEPTTPEVQEIVRGSTPLRRLAEPRDIARAVTACASDHLGFATGQYIAGRSEERRVGEGRGSSGAGATSKEARV